MKLYVIILSLFFVACSSSVEQKKILVKLENSAAMRKDLYTIKYYDDYISVKSPENHMTIYRENTLKYINFNRWYKLLSNTVVIDSYDALALDSLDVNIKIYDKEKLVRNISQYGSYDQEIYEFVEDL